MTWIQTITWPETLPVYTFSITGKEKHIPETRYDSSRWYFCWEDCKNAAQQHVHHPRKYIIHIHIQEEILPPPSVLITNLILFVTEKAIQEKICEHCHGCRGVSHEPRDHIRCSTQRWKDNVRLFFPEIDVAFTPYIERIARLLNIQSTGIESCLRHNYLTPSDISVMIQNGLRDERFDTLFEFP